MAKVLVVDDYEMTLVAMQMLLQQAGHEVMTASSGARVAAKVRRDPPDLVITDILMPEQDGLGLISEIRDFNATLPIIAISGGAQTLGPDYLEYAQEMGANAILAKPFDKARLLSLIDQLLGLPPAR